jgi:FtsP/CotA-like multicopper oxidase with cupredoxin domain
MNIKLLIFAALVVGFCGGLYVYSRNSSNSTSQVGKVLSTDAASATISTATSSSIVELKDGDTYNITASIVKRTIAGSEVKMLAYNGSIPGPIIKVAQGAEVTINFTNNIDIPTTLHSHGLRLDNAYDGVPDVTQKEIPVGGSFTYKLKFPDAGMYWYHPHIREDYAQELGLYGNYLVEPTDANYWNPVNREVPLFLDDISMENGQVAPFYQKTANHTLMGRYGNVMLVNGEDNYQLSAKKGEVIRFYLTNSANVRPFRFVIDGVKMKLVGGDNGAYEYETWTDGVIIAPSERYVVEVLFDHTGTYSLLNQTPDKATPLGTVTVTDDVATPSYSSSFSVLKTHDTVVKSIDPFRQYFEKPLDKQINLTVDLSASMQKMMGGGSSGGGMMNGGGMMGGGSHMMPDGTMMGGGGMMMEIPKDGIEWENTMQMMMDTIPDTSMVKWKIVDQETNKANMDIDWKFKVGDKVKIRINNDAKSMHPMQHPVHFHGQRFLVLNRNGVEQTNLVWKDTVLVPAGQYVDILLDASNPGTWMAHCHIAEHLESGMMFDFKVE